jgi:hypothetical protein
MHAVQSVQSVQSVVGCSHPSHNAAPPAQDSQTLARDPYPAPGANQPKREHAIPQPNLCNL